jgi:GrpE
MAELPDEWWSARWLLTAAVAVVAGLLAFSAVLWLAPGGALLAGLVAALVTAAGVIAVAVLTTMAAPPHGRATPWPAAPVSPQPGPAVDPRLHQLADQRGTVVRGLAELVPQLPDGLVWQATNLLSAVGVREVVPDGERFDPRLHHAVGTQASAEAVQVDTVARTVRPGFLDGESVLTYPKVVVYTADPVIPGTVRP